MSFALAVGWALGAKSRMTLQAVVTRAEAASLVSALARWYLAELWTNCLFSVHRSAGLTVTAKVVVPVPVLPAWSVADADRVCAPGPNDHAGPLVLAQVDEATPDRSSAAVQAMATLLSSG